MDVALEVWSADIDRLTETARLADRLGLHALYLGESPNGLNLDCFTTLAALASVTEQLRVGPVIACILDDYRSLALLAKQAATVAVVSGGRFDFRTGVGAARAFGSTWWEPFGVRYGAYDQRLAELTSALPILVDLWSAEPTGALPPLGFDVPPIPITMAATGDRARAVANGLADCWEISFSTPAEVTAHRDRAGDQRPARLSLEIDGFVGSTPARAAAVERVLRNERGSEDIEAILTRSLRGTADDVSDQLRSLSAAGVDQVVVALHDPHNLDAVTTLAEAADEVVARPVS